MAKIDDACRDIVESVDGGIAAGVVDLETGMLMGVHNDAAHAPMINEFVAAACLDMFRSTNVVPIERAVRPHRDAPKEGEQYFSEVHLTSKQKFHFAKAIKAERAVVVLVTEKSTNIGMGWAQLRAAIPAIEPLVP